MIMRSKFSLRRKSRPTENHTSTDNWYLIVRVVNAKLASVRLQQFFVSEGKHIEDCLAERKERTVLKDV